MARVVTLAELPGESVGPGVVRASVTGGQTSWMEAETLTLSAGASLEQAAPDGSDCYLFVLRGAARLAVDGTSQEMPLQAVAVIQEGTAFSIANAFDGETLILRVLAPPKDAGGDFAGFAEGVAVRARADLPLLVVPEQKKKRYFIAGKESLKSQRAHVMIVEYQHDTLTPLHHHPNADSMFVLLEGNINFVVDGKNVVVTPGQVTMFKAGDIHSLRCADGTTEAGFLEFHVPGAFTTVRE